MVAFETTVEQSIEKFESITGDWDDDAVYVVLGFARKKYNKELQSASSDSYKSTLFREVLTKQNYARRIRRILTLMYNYTDGRVRRQDFTLYVTVNPRSPRKALRTIKHWIADQEYDGTITEWLLRFDSRWISALQKSSAVHKKQFFLVDVDNPAELFGLEDILKAKGMDYLEYPSRNGYHVLIKPTNPKVLYDEFENNGLTSIEIKHDDLLSLFSGDLFE